MESYIRLLPLRLVVLVAMVAIPCCAYLSPASKDPGYLSETMLRDLFDQTLAKHYLMDGNGRSHSALRNNNEDDAATAYIDPMMQLDVGGVGGDDTVDDMPRRLASLLQQQLQQQQLKTQLQAEQLDYDSLLAARGLNARPSLRDQEYAHQSSLWGHHFVHSPVRHQLASTYAGEGDDYVADGAVERQHQQQQQPSDSEIIVTTKDAPNGGAFANAAAHLKAAQLKTDVTLPAYCNPPNPCPVGYTADSGCLDEFENTAAFSRDYQAAQECMCDNEHMFVCQQETDKRPQQQQGGEEYGGFLKRQFEPAQEHKSLVAKKFHPSTSSEARLNPNPYLEGEKLPVAAKKGIRTY